MLHYIYIKYYMYLIHKGRKTANTTKHINEIYSNFSGMPCGILCH